MNAPRWGETCPDMSPDRWLGIEVEVLQGPHSTEPGGADPQPGTGCVARGQFAFQHGSEVVVMDPARIPGLDGG